MNPVSQSEQLRQRRPLLFWFFVTTFFPLVIFTLGYGAGYRYDDRYDKLVRHSALAIEATPASIQVSINGQAQLEKTPFIDTVEPGTYTIALHKDGYQQWQKELRFEAGKSHLFPDVILFQDNAPVHINAHEAFAEPSELQGVTEPLFERMQALEFDTTHELRYSDEEGVVTVVDVDQQRTYLLPSFRSNNRERIIHTAVTNSDWNENQVLAFSSGSELQIYDYAEKKLTVLLRQTDPITDVLWHPEGAYIFYADTQGIHVVELDERDTRQRWTLVNGEGISNIAVSSRGDQISYKQGDAYYMRTLYKRAE